MRIALLSILSVIFLAGCTPPLTETELGKLTKQADAVTQALAASLQVQNKLISETYENRRLCTYLSGGNVGLLPTKPTQKPSKTATSMAQFAGSLGGYTKSLNEAANGGSIAALQKASGEFQAQVAATGQVLGDPRIGAAAEPLLNFGLRLGEQGRQEQIRKIMEDALVALIVVEDDVIRDAPLVVQENRSLIGAWEKAARCVLRQMRRDPDAATEKFDEITASRKSIEGQTKIVEKAPALLTALMEAHVFAAAEAPSLELGLKNLEAAYNDIVALAEAFEGEEDGKS